MKSKKVCVIGLGYIGLPTALFLAAAGNLVIGVDVDQEKIDKLKRGVLPFQENGLKALLSKAKKNISFSITPSQAEVYIIAVPTPFKANKKADLSYVKQACLDLAKVVEDGSLIILESTVPPETIEKTIKPIFAKQHKKKDLYFAHAPERAIPGKTLIEMQNNDRIIGGNSEEATRLAINLYKTFVKGKIYSTNDITAEFVKLIENTYRDVNIAFANSLAKIAHQVDINVWEAIKLANLHPRVNIHNPGPGVGGHCIGVDPWFLVSESYLGDELIKLSRLINDSMPKYVISRIKNFLKKIDINNITILGLSYKPDVDDWRETPALGIIKEAKKSGWKVKLHDPFVNGFPHPLERELKAATKDSDCLVIVADHEFYKKLKPKDIKNMKHNNVFDTRNCLNKKIWNLSGFNLEIL